MLKSLTYIAFFLLISCVGSDTAFLPDTIAEARKDHLLIHIYEPNLRTVRIHETDYYLENAFTTFKFNTKNDLTINKNFFAFIIKLKNLKTGEVGLSLDPHLNFYDYIDFNSDHAGIQDSNLAISYDEISKRDNLDTVTIGFKDAYKKEIKIQFIKKN